MPKLTLTMGDRLARFPVFVRLAVFAVTLAIVWLPLAWMTTHFVSNPNSAGIAAMALLFIEFLAWVTLWGRWLYHHPWVIRRYGLVSTRQNGLEMLQGLALGGISLFALFGVQGMLGWLKWSSPPPHIACVILEGVLVALGVGLAEELLFRGFILDELERDYHLTRSLWISSLVFAILHFIRPIQEMIRTLPQFPGLVVLGLALVWAKRSHHNRLGFPIGFHAGLVWVYYVISVGNWIHYTHHVPEWVSGIDQNPLAGIMGLLFLGGLMLVVRPSKHPHINSSPRS
ncbi:MAG: CPBP family intramembrane glutamic endopeptidase [Elainellaceae cyanobacterium]